MGILPHLLISALLHLQSLLFSLKRFRISEKDTASAEDVKEERDLYKSRVLLSSHSSTADMGSQMHLYTQMKYTTF